MSRQLPRIVIVNDASQVQGGATKLAVALAAALAQRGREVVFFAGDEGRNPDLVASGVEVRALGKSRLLDAPPMRAALDGAWNFAGAQFVGNWIRSAGRPDDVWHVHSWAQIWSPSVFRALEPVGRRLIVHAHDYFPACPNGAFWDHRAKEPCDAIPLSRPCLTRNCDKRTAFHKPWRLARHSLLKGRFTSADAPLLVMVHPAMRPAFERSGIAAERMVALRNPVEPMSRSRVRAEDNGAVLFAGRLSSEKGAILLARAAQRIGGQVVFAGDGPDIAEIRRLCPGAEVTGWLGRAELSEQFAKARALAMPSLWQEPFGLVAAEALALGIPVLASRAALVCKEIVSAGAGWEFEPSVKSSLDQALAAIFAASDDEIHQRSMAALRISASVAQPFESWVDGIEEIYRTEAAQARLRG